MAPPHTKVAKGVVKSMELLQDTKITSQNKKSKGIAESKCPNFSFNHISHASMGLKLMYFIPHKCFPTLELVELVKRAFDSTWMAVRDPQGKVVLNLYPPSIVKAFSPPPPQSTPMLVTYDTRPSANRRTNLLVWLKKNAKGAMSFIEVPQSEVLMSNFNLHVQLLLSMLSIAIAKQSDRYISPAKLTIAYLISHPKSFTIYNWLVVISNRISE